MIKIFVIDVNKLLNEDFSFVKNVYPLRANKALQYKNENDQKLCLAVAYLWSKAGLKEEDINYTSLGKPTSNKTFLSYAHTGHVAILAISDEEVGIDIEDLDREIKVDISRLFTEDEQILVKHVPAFLIQYWTRKEAVVKYYGKGLAMPLNSFNVMDDDVSVGNDDIKLYTDELFNEYVWTVCSKNVDYQLMIL